MIVIEHLRDIIKENGKVHLTLHLLDRLRERKKSYHDVINAIQNGEIIEQYQNDYPHPGCLILGKSLNDSYLHIVCGTDREHLWIITAYYPNADKWINDFKTRKEQ
ncbi:MAG: DUF4258 domain-containing protein [Ruminococcaceae bacterium]|nr:DUF4258 domain-containing protein [Oscillospiraceae bacterium]